MFPWTPWQGGTPSAGTGPTGAASGLRYLYIEASGRSPGQKAVVQLPRYDFTALLADETIHLEWQDHMYGASVGTLEVQVRSTASPTWTTVFSRTGSQGNAWNQRSMNLTSRWGQFVDIRFVATVGASFSSDIAIDDVQVRAIPFWW